MRMVLGKNPNLEIKEIKTDLLCCHCLKQKNTAQICSCVTPELVTTELTCLNTKIDANC